MVSEAPTSKSVSLVERLREDWGLPRTQALCDEAADEIERLRALAGPSGKSLGILEELNDGLCDENERLRGRMDHGTRQVAAIITWLEANQPDVFKRGLWDAIPKDPPLAHKTGLKFVEVGDGHPPIEL